MNVRRSISINFVTRYVEHGLALVSGMVLARWLTPEDFGIYSIAASVVLIGYLFRNFGVGQFIVQAKELSDDILRAAFSVTLVVSWSIGLMVILAAPFLGRFYETEGVTIVMYFLSFNFFLLPFGSVTNSLLRREMLFEKIAVIDVSAAVASLVVGLTAAWFGASYLAIAWAANASTLASILVTQMYRPAGTPWMPGVKRFREIFTFGVKVGAMDLSNSGTDSVTELTIGRAHGLHDLGIYSRAYGTFRLFEFAFAQTIRPVVLPYLSKSKHKDENIGEFYLNIIALTTIFTIPFFIFLGVNAAEVIGLLYGGQWGAAVPVLQIMCAAGALFAPTIFFEQLLIANGRPGQAARYIMQSQAVRLVALFILAWISLEAAAVALGIGFLTRIMLVARMARHHFNLSGWRFVKAVQPAVFTALVLGGATWGVRSLVLPLDNVFVSLAATAATAAVVWLGTVHILRHPITGELRGVVRKITGR